MFSQRQWKFKSITYLPTDRHTWVGARDTCLSKKYKKKICVILWENRPPAANPCKKEFKSPTQDKHEFTALSCELKSRCRDYARKNN